MAVPDWQLPRGVDRGLWDYLHSTEMVRGYAAQMSASPLAAADVRFCESVFDRPGRLADLGCGAGRLCGHFAAKGYECVGVDLSPEMLAAAREAVGGVEWVAANLVDLTRLTDGSFRFAACLFSTLGMVRGADERAAAVRTAYRILEPGGRYVIHVHNRWYRGLGFRRLAGQAWKTLRGATDEGDVTMPQAYAGAPLTLHHFTKAEAVGLLTTAGFRILRMEPVVTSEGIYGYLIAAEKPTH